MAISVGDILQFRVRYTYIDVEMMNVFYYIVHDTIGGGNMAATLSGSFLPNVIGQVRNLQMTAVEYIDVVGVNLTDDADEATVPYLLTGNVAVGSGSPTFVSVGFKLVRASRNTRHGSKRFGGISEDSTDINNPVYAGTVVADVETALAAPLDLLNALEGSVGTIEPVIVGRVRFVDDPEHAGELDLTRFSLVSAAQITRVTTQNTRKK